MEPKRLGGALLTSAATGVGIMVPYTFKTMTPALMAVIWAVLVFAGIIGLVFALKPEAQVPPAGPVTTREPTPAGATPKRRSLIDRDALEVFAGMLAIPAFMIGFLILLGVIFAVVRGLGWIVGV